MEKGVYALTVAPGDFFWRVVYHLIGVYSLGNNSWTAKLTAEQAQKMRDLSTSRGYCSIRPLVEEYDPDGSIRNSYLEGGEST